MMFLLKQQNNFYAVVVLKIQRKNERGIKMFKNNVVLLRISYWMGAILDAKAALIALFPNISLPLYISIGGNPEAINSIEAVCFRMLASIMVFGWTCLLLWADRKPFERKNVLLLTIFPVLTGILTIRLYRLFIEPKPPIGYNLFTILLIVLLIFFAISYTITCYAEKRNSLEV